MARDEQSRDLLPIPITDPQPCPNSELIIEPTDTTTKREATDRGARARERDRQTMREKERQRERDKERLEFTCAYLAGPASVKFTSSQLTKNNHHSHSTYKHTDFDHLIKQTKLHAPREIHNVSESNFTFTTLTKSARLSGSPGASHS